MTSAYKIICRILQALFIILAVWVLHNKDFFLSMIFLTFSAGFAGLSGYSKELGHFKEADPRVDRSKYWIRNFPAGNRYKLYAVPLYVIGIKYIIGAILLFIYYFISRNFGHDPSEIEFIILFVLYYCATSEDLYKNI